MQTHLVLGAGQIGPRVASLLVERGHRVRIGRRSASSSSDIETISIDVRDPAAVAKAAEGASVVYSCVNPAYDQWPTMLLPMVRGITEGTKRAGARLVALDCLYMYGDTHHMTEASPNNPVSKKGVLRAEAGKILEGAGAAIGRAADFFGPEAPQAILGEHFWKRVMAGKSGQVFGDPDQVHSYTYTPDVAKALVALGSRDVSGIWMLPTLPAETTRQVVARFSKALGRDIAISSVPTWLLKALGVFQPMMREIAEMTYQWKQPYVLDDSKFRKEFGFGPTPWDEAIAETVRWARTTWPSESARIAA